MRNTMVGGLVIAAVAVIAAAAGDVAQGRGQAQPDVLQALLAEVRGLRAAMEQMASAGPRIELALGRLQLQEQRVSTLLRRHAELREGLARLENGVTMTTQEMERMQETARTSADENVQKNAQGLLEETKQRLSIMHNDLQRLRVEEAEIAQALHLEQSRWTEINQRLEELERALSRR